MNSQRFRTLTPTLLLPLFALFAPAALFVSVLATGATPAMAQEVLTIEEDDILSLEEEGTASDATLKAWLNEGVTQLEQGAYIKAALKFNEAVQNPNPHNIFYQEAQYLLGATLFGLGLYESAFMRFEGILDYGSNHPKYRNTLHYLLEIARATENDPSVVSRIADFPPELYALEEADELHFRVGQYFLAEEQLGDALVRFQSITDKDKVLRARSQYLEGVIHVAQSGLGHDSDTDPEKLTLAAEAFKAVLRTQKTAPNNKEIQFVADQAILALGRLFYSTGQYDIAISYYNEVSEDNPEWLQGLYEKAWVHFQLGNFPKSLGLLHSVNTPFFKDQYFPESRVLQALALFYNCYYKEADAIVAEFVQDYYPLRSQFKAEINQFADPNAFYNWLAQLASKATSDEYSIRFKRIFNAALTDKKLKQKFELVQILNKELKKLEQLNQQTAGSSLISNLTGDLDAYRSLVIGEAGSLAQTRLLRIVEDLQKHLASALKIRGETLRATRGDLSSATKNAQNLAAQKQRPLIVDDEHIEWPFDGDYWKDEVTSYVYAVPTRCSSNAL